MPSLCSSRHHSRQWLEVASTRQKFRVPSMFFMLYSRALSNISMDGVGAVGAECLLCHYLGEYHTEGREATVGVNGSHEGSQD